MIVDTINERIRKMTNVKLTDIEPDDRGMNFGYLRYSIAKSNGLKKGSTFTTADDGSQWVVKDYVDFRPDTNRKFAGFRVDETS